MAKKRKPTWRTLIIWLLIMLGLLGLIATTPMSPLQHELALIGLLTLTYGTIMVWVRVNRQALLEQEREQRKREQVSAQQPAPALARVPEPPLPRTPVQQHYLEVLNPDQPR